MENINDLIKQPEDIRTWMMFWNSDLPKEAPETMTLNSVLEAMCTEINYLRGRVDDLESTTRSLERDKENRSYGDYY